MFTELITEILQEISLEFVLVEEIIPFIHYRLEPAATDVEELDIDLCNKFREYLLTAKKLKRNGHITRNSASL